MIQQDREHCSLITAGSLHHAPHLAGTSHNAGRNAFVQSLGPDCLIMLQESGAQDANNSCQGQNAESQRMSNATGYLHTPATTKYIKKHIFRMIYNEYQ
jgi:hypothetical protein